MMFIYSIIICPYQRISIGNYEIKVLRSHGTTWLKCVKCAYATATRFHNLYKYNIYVYDIINQAIFMYNNRHTCMHMFVLWGSHNFSIFFKFVFRIALTCTLAEESRNLKLDILPIYKNKKKKIYISMVIPLEIFFWYTTWKKMSSWNISPLTNHFSFGGFSYQSTKIISC